MKKLLLLCFILITCLQSNAQVVFCPAGAEWHYSFLNFAGAKNETIKYSHDSLLGVENVKVLTHSRFYMSCDGHSLMFTLIKQKGDTVFFRNAQTQHGWQILYNFNVQVGQGWQTTFRDYNNIVVTNSYTASSVSTVTINNIPLKKINFGSASVTERIGSDAFLFMTNYSTSCDGDLFYENLCYQDSTFGLKQFTSLPCDYSTQLYAGVTEEFSKSNFKIYPNPISSVFIVEMNSTKSTQLTLTDIYGKELKREAFENTNRIDVSDLKSGLYLIVLKQEGEVIATTKIVKE